MWRRNWLITLFVLLSSIAATQLYKIPEYSSPLESPYVVAGENPSGPPAYGNSECNCLRWTNWISADTPSDTGDWETLGPPDERGRPGTIHHVRPDICTVPVRMECRTVEDKIPWHATKDKITYQCNPLGKGFSCQNHKQGVEGTPYETESGSDYYKKSGYKCRDYEARVLCFYTSGYNDCPCLYWTKWFNSDNPTTGYGDEELIGYTLPQYVCEGNYEPVDVQCKTVSGMDVFHAGNKKIQCDLRGLKCDNSEQGKNCKCHDYEVRFLCPRFSATYPISVVDYGGYAGKNKSYGGDYVKKEDEVAGDYSRAGSYGAERPPPPPPPPPPYRGGGAVFRGSEYRGGAEYGGRKEYGGGAGGAEYGGAEYGGGGLGYGGGAEYGGGVGPAIGAEYSGGAAYGAEGGAEYGGGSEYRGGAGYGAEAGYGAGLGGYGSENSKVGSEYRGGSEYGVGGAAEYGGSVGSEYGGGGGGGGGSEYGGAASEYGGRGGEGEYGGDLTVSGGYSHAGGMEVGGGIGAGYGYGSPGYEEGYGPDNYEHPTYNTQDEYLAPYGGPIDMDYSDSSSYVGAEGAAGVEAGGAGAQYEGEYSKGSPPYGGVPPPPYGGPKSEQYSQGLGYPGSGYEKDNYKESGYKTGSESQYGNKGAAYRTKQSYKEGLETAAVNYKADYKVEARQGYGADSGSSAAAYATESRPEYPEPGPSYPKPPYNADPYVTKD